LAAVVPVHEVVEQGTEPSRADVVNPYEPKLRPVTVTLVSPFIAKFSGRRKDRAGASKVSPDPLDVPDSNEMVTVLLLRPSMVFEAGAVQAIEVELDQEAVRQ
jgi:hypothetical protein